MGSTNFKKHLIILTLAMICGKSIPQSNVPFGIHYQAVARDNFGTELANRRISVKFSIISGDPLGTPVYQELHQDVTTSKYGVFSLVIGKGIPTGNSPFGELSQIEWKNAFHYLKVEVKFENTFMDMGTMQFLAVPYALFAQKSLATWPAGPKVIQVRPAERRSGPAGQGDRVRLVHKAMRHQIVKPCLSLMLMAQIILPFQEVTR